MSYFVVAGAKQLLKTLHKKFPAIYTSDLFVIYKALPPEISNCSVKVTTITDDEFRRIELQKLTDLFKENASVLCKSGNFKGMVGILRKVSAKSNGDTHTCIVELSTGGGMRLVELSTSEIEPL